MPALLQSRSSSSTQWEWVNNMTQDEINSLFGAVDTQTARNAPQPNDKTLEELFAEGSKEEPATVGSTLTAPFSGFNKALPHAIGWPVDLINWGMKKAGLPVSETPLGGSESVKKIMPQEIEPKGRLERALQAGGEGLAYTMAPEAALRATAPKVAGAITQSPAGITARETLENIFGAKGPPTKAGMAENIATNLGAGAAAEAASELVPDRWKSLAGMGGGLAGGVGTQLATSGAKTIPTMARGIYEYLQPALGAAGQKAEAARQFAGGLKSPAAVQDVLENEKRSLVPGSEPTTFELTGDIGAGQMQRQAETAAPGPFIERKGQQATARQGALEGVAGEGSPLDVTKAVEKQFADLDKYEAGITQAAEDAAKKEVEALGGKGTPEDYGRILREKLQAAKDAANTQRRQLYQAIDPDGTLNVVATGVKDAAAKIAEEAAAPLAEKLEGKLAGIVKDVGAVGDVVPFSQLRTLDTRISDAMKVELKTNGETNTYRLLSQMKESVLNSINNAVENQAKYEADAIKSGKMPGAGGLQERLQGLQSVMGSAELPKGGLEPNLTPEAVARLDAAKQAHKDYVERFREGSPGAVLKPAGFGNYAVPLDASVGQKLFVGGDKGFETAQAFRNSVKDEPAAIQQMADYITSKMLSETVDPKTGIIDPKRFQAWKDTHKDALRAFPELAPKLSTAAKASEAAFEAAAASRTRLDAAQKQGIAKVIGAEDPETVTKIIGNIFGQADAPKQMRGLVQATAGNPEARQGLQKAVADYIRGRFISTTEASTSEANLINSASFQKFIRSNRKVLGQVFDQEQVNTLQALADDLNRSARSVTGNALSGRSTTAQDLSPMAQKASSYFKSLTGLTAAAGGAGSLGALASGPIAAALGVGTVAAGALVNSLRSAGMTNVNDIIREALLNPEFARELLKSVPRTPAPEAVRPLSEKIAKLGITSIRPAAIGNSEDKEASPRFLTIPGPGNRPTRATGGAVNLMALSKAAKKHVTRSTEDLLNESDDTVARALEVANKHI